MAGHSQFKNIMHHKKAQDIKRAKCFTKILREVTVAAKAGGVDPQLNARLRTALIRARQNNVPKEKLERAIGASQEDNTHYESVHYGAMGSGQSAFFIEVLTDNRNRTISDIRLIFNKNHVRLGEVQHLFQQWGMIFYEKRDSAFYEKLLECAIQVGVVDIQEDEDTCVLLCERRDFFRIKDDLDAQCHGALQAHIGWWPHNLYQADAEEVERLHKLVTALEDLDDVQHVWSNVQQLVYA